jgi:hypothetical protein
MKKSPPKETAETSMMRTRADRHGKYLNKTGFLPAETHKKAVDPDLNGIPQGRKTQNRKTDSRYQSHIQHALSDHPGGIDA